MVSEDVVSALQMLDCRVSQYSYAKWLAADELFDGKQVSQASLAFAAFVALRSIETLTQSDKELIADLLNSRRSEEGIPLKWDVIVVEHLQS